MPHSDAAFRMTNRFYDILCYVRAQELCEIAGQARNDVDKVVICVI
jgi:hypothetical protein